MATGKQQFTALMSPQEELRVGAAEHEKIVQQFGLYDNDRINTYVQEIGARVAKNTERTDVTYKFYVIDSPIVNAFALPGGYVYVSRGLLALANDEAELAGVIAHEIGHVTGRHSAERYSQAVLTQVGATVLSILIDQPGASDALDLGSNLYLKSYSRGQESEADSLGLRYMARAGYDPKAMADFLTSLQRDTALQDKITGNNDKVPGYFSTHPATSKRIAETNMEADQYASVESRRRARDTYLGKIGGMVYGDNQDQGFVRGRSFYHPEIGFGFEAPPQYRMINKPSQIIMQAKNSNAVMIFDMVSVTKTAGNYLAQDWVGGERLDDLEEIEIGGMNAATASFAGSVNGRKSTIRLMAIKWSGDRMARFQIAIPRGTSDTELDELKRATYSFHRLSAQEKSQLKPSRIKIITATAEDTVASLAHRQSLGDYKEEHFRVLNGLAPSAPLVKGQKYKLIAE